MKKLELNQMENLNGGSDWACAGSVMGAVAGVAAVALAIPTGGLTLLAAGAGMLAADFAMFDTCG